MLELLITGMIFPKIDLDGNTFSNYSSIENMWGGTPNTWYLQLNQTDPENYPLIYDGNMLM